MRFACPNQLFNLDRRWIFIILIDSDEEDFNVAGQTFTWKQ